MPLKRVLVTGGTGFIGRNVAEALSSRHAVSAPPRRELDLLDEEAVAAYLKKGAFDAVVHGAVTPGHRNARAPEGLFHKNLRMFTNLARCAGDFGRLINLGSGAEYDMRHYLPKMKEEYFGRHVPADESGFSKFLISEKIESMADAVNLRLFGVFGKHEDYEIRFISNAVCKALFGRPITLKQDRRFDYLFVEDLPPVLERFIEGPARHKAYNVTPDAAVGLKEIAGLVRAVSGKDVDIVVGQPGLGAEYSGDNARLKAEMPGFKTTPLEEAVRRLYAWYAERPGLVREEALSVDK